MLSVNPDRLIARALEIGFDIAGIGPATLTHAADFQSWLDAGFAGDMAWMSTHVDRRLAPAAKTAVVVGLRYFIEEPPPDLWNDPMRGRVARYAWGRDYHDVLRPMLDELAGFVRAETGSAARAHVDSGPVLERDLAVQAGLGFVGKNTNLIHREWGSFLFIGELLLDFQFAISDLQLNAGAASAAQTANRKSKIKNPCGRCVRCLKACPTGAFAAPYVLDSRKCISFLTIENKGAIPEALRPKMGNWIFGCDECQQVCPWNGKLTPSHARFLKFDADRCAPKLADLLAMSESDFRERFAGTPVLRAKRRGLLRNAVVALGNSGDPAAPAILEMAARDAEPLVREQARAVLGSTPLRSRHSGT